ncbi:MAG: hypothetical protein ACRC92_26050 [Peptostreptococcaceae bacterium]
MALIKIRDAVTNHHTTHAKKYDSGMVKSMDKKPNYAIYYEQNADESTTSVGWENVKTPIGDDSPSRFTKYHDMVLLGQLELPNTENEMDEHRGIKTNRDTSFLVLPDTINPKEGDFLTFYHQKHTMLYRVFKVERTLVKNRDFIKISIMLFNGVESGQIEKIQKQVIAEKTMIYENYGGEYKTIIKTENVDTLRTLQYVEYELSKMFIEQFYSKYYSTILLEIEDTFDVQLVYMPMMVEFISRKSPIQYSDVTSLVIPHALELPRNFRKEFLNSVFHKITVDGIIEDKTVLPLKLRKLDKVEYSYSQLRRHYGNEIICKLDVCNDTEKTHTVELYKNKVLTSEKYDKDLENFIENYMNEMDCNIDYFVTIPLVLYKIRKFIGDVCGKPLYQYDDIYQYKGGSHG